MLRNLAGPHKNPNPPSTLHREKAGGVRSPKRLTLNSHSYPSARAELSHRNSHAIRPDPARPRRPGAAASRARAVVVWDVGLYVQDGRAVDEIHPGEPDGPLRGVHLLHLCYRKQYSSICSNFSERRYKKERMDGRTQALVRLGLAAVTMYTGVEKNRDRSTRGQSFRNSPCRG